MIRCYATKTFSQMEESYMGCFAHRAAGERMVGWMIDRFAPFALTKSP